MIFSISEFALSHALPNAPYQYVLIPQAMQVNVIRHHIPQGIYIDMVAVGLVIPYVLFQHTGKCGRRYVSHECFFFDKHIERTLDNLTGIPSIDLHLVHSVFGFLWVVLHRC